jgi:TonB-linked SusC/RagA family outer membrane protein
MKLALILMTGACLQVHAAGFAQRITLSANNMPLEKVFNEIRQQSGYLFLYEDKALQKAHNVNINLIEVTIEEALNQCFKNQPLEYKVVEKTILVKPLPQPPQPIKITGKVYNLKGDPLSGASILVKGKNKGSIADTEGGFVLEADAGATLVISYMGYKTQEININNRTSINIILIEDAAALQEVEFVSTGYQQIPRAKAAGSYELVNNEELNRRVGTDVISRLEGVSTSIFFDKRAQEPTELGIPLNRVTIRGLNTMSMEMDVRSPLIVVDDLPYTGDISNINPNDVDNITLLRDAGSASIYGAKSANGVIVITTKKGSYNQPLKVTFNTNLNIVDKPDLFKFEAMSSSDFIDVEEFLFSKGFYNSLLSDSKYPAVSPVVELLNQKSKLPANDIEGRAAIDDQINALRSLDIRNDFQKYIYQTAVNQQYAINAAGGSQNIKYVFSVGLDRNKNSLVGNSTQRITLRSNNSYRLSKNLEINLGISYANSKNEENSLGHIGNYTYDMSSSFGIYPYAQLADANGNPLAIPHSYSLGYVDTAGTGKLLDWHYRPLDEIKNGNNTMKSTEVTINSGITYRPSNFLSVQAYYQYSQSTITYTNLYSTETYYARNLINLFTQVNGSTVTYVVPKGNILKWSPTDLKSQIGRIQLTYDKKWGMHQISAFAGSEAREDIRTSNGSLLYGLTDNYDVTNVDFVNRYPQYGGRGTTTIPGPGTPSKKDNTFISLYAHAAYTYNNRYTFTASLRRDASNLFGVDINNKWKPLWTVGGTWVISEEPFFKQDWISWLKLRASYGYLGNTNNSISPYTIISFGSNSTYFGQTYANISVPGNPGLSWETMKNINIGIDFNMLDNRVRGSVDVYSKKSDNLILGASTDVTRGVVSVERNSATLSGKGMDISLITANIRKPFEWNTELLFSYVSNLVVDHMVDQQYLRAGNAVSGSGGTIRTLIKGRTPYAIYSFPFAGLDPSTGDPMGYLGDAVSKNYTSLYNQLFDTARLVFHGSAIPVVHGSFNNTFTYKAFSLSFSMDYNFGYYFRKSTIRYQSLYYYNTHPDFSKRWQQAGDEAFTTVPSMIYPATSTYRDDFYSYSSPNVLKGDHIRLQYIRFSYMFNKNLAKKLSLRDIQIYAVANNLGILWRANKEGLDPAYSLSSGSFPAPKSIALGVKFEL